MWNAEFVTQFDIFKNNFRIKLKLNLAWKAAMPRYSVPSDNDMKTIWKRCSVQ